jgi:hypothetical protein
MSKAYTFTPAPGLPSEKREQLSFALASVRTPGKGRGRSAKAARDATEKRGERVLGDEQPRGKYATRFVYLSEGGEILCSHFVNLTKAQQSALQAVSLDPRKHKPVRDVVFPSEAWVLVSAEWVDAVTSLPGRRAA